MSAEPGYRFWNSYCPFGGALARHTGGVDAPARSYRNKIVSEGLTASEEQEAWEMLDEWGY